MTRVRIPARAYFINFKKTKLYHDKTYKDLIYRPNMWFRRKRKDLALDTKSDLATRLGYDGELSRRLIAQGKSVDETADALIEESERIKSEEEEKSTNSNPSILARSKTPFKNGVFYASAILAIYAASPLGWGLTPIIIYEKVQEEKSKSVALESIREYSGEDGIWSREEQTKFLEDQIASGKFKKRQGTESSKGDFLYLKTGSDLPFAGGTYDSQEIYIIKGIYPRENDHFLEGRINKGTRGNGITLGSISREDLAYNVLKRKSKDISGI
jgi:hypothetical protein